MDARERRKKNRVKKLMTDPVTGGTWVKPMRESTRAERRWKKKHPGEEFVPVEHDHGEGSEGGDSGYE